MESLVIGLTGPSSTIYVRTGQDINDTPLIVPRCHFPLLFLSSDHLPVSHK